MNSKWHLYISITKSIIRIIACLLTLINKNIGVLAIGFLIAEMLGVLEEIKDNR